MISFRKMVLSTKIVNSYEIFNIKKQRNNFFPIFSSQPNSFTKSVSGSSFSIGLDTKVIHKEQEIPKCAMQEMQIF